MSRLPVTITIWPSGASAGAVHQSFMCREVYLMRVYIKIAGAILRAGRRISRVMWAARFPCFRIHAGPSVIYLSSLPPGTGRAARRSRSPLPVYLTLQPARCAARHIAVAPGGLLPRLFILAVGSRRSRLGGCFLSHYSTVADSSPKGVRCSLLPGLSSPASCVRERRTRHPGADLSLRIVGCVWSTRSRG